MNGQINMRQQCVLTVDVGSSSIRVSLFDDNLGQMDCRSCKTEKTVVLDAMTCWIQICDLAKKLLSGKENRIELCGIGVSSQLAWLCIDENRDSVAPAATWVDQSPAQMKTLAEKIGEKVIYQKTARRLSSEFGGLKVAKLREENPAAYAKAKFFVSLKDFINFKLTGIIATDRTYACYSLLYNPVAGIWDKEIIDALQIDGRLLPPLLDADEILGDTLQDCEFPVPSGIPVVTSGPDGTVGVLGAGGEEPGVAVNIMGTTDVFFTCSNTFVTDKNRSLIVNPHVIKGRWVVGGPMGLSGGAVDWLLHELLADCVDVDAINAQAAKIPLGNDNLLMNSGLTGERAPFWNSHMAGNILGIRLEHTAAHFFRAIMEGNSCAVRQLCENCKRASLKIDQIVAIGGATRHQCWLQIKADITGLPILLPEMMEATSVGCAVLAWRAVGHSVRIKESNIFQRIYPKAENRAAADKLFMQYQALMQNAGKYYESIREENTNVGTA
jgi:xylulokinase